MLSSCPELRASFPCQPHRSCEGSSWQPDKESGHRVGCLRSPCQRCGTSKCRAGFIHVSIHIHGCKSVLSGVCFYMIDRAQSFQKQQWRTTRILVLTSLGGQFRIALLKGWEFQKRCVTVKTEQQNSIIMFYKWDVLVLLVCLCSDIIISVFPTLTCCLLHIWSHPEGWCRTESVPLNVGDTKCEDPVDREHTLVSWLCTEKLNVLFVPLDHSAWPEAPEGENLDAMKELLNPQSKL